MKKSYRIDGLDCGSCAIKIEDAIRKIDGVRDVSVNFFTQKLQLEIEDDKFDSAEILALKAAKKIEPTLKILD